MSEYSDVGRYRWLVAEPKGAGWSLGLVDAPLQLFRELKPNKRPFWVYMNCVQPYTRRKWTFANDILAAFSGISNLLADTMDAPLVFGLPSSHFDLALLWVMNGPMVRRLPKAREKQRWGQDEFPSWSWCGWLADEEVKASIEYKTDMIEGCLQNVNEWIVNHTWVHWYIRDGHSDLRPIWFIQAMTLTMRNRRRRRRVEAKHTRDGKGKRKKTVGRGYPKSMNMTGTVTQGGLAKVSPTRLLDSTLCSLTPI